MRHAPSHLLALLLALAAGAAAAQAPASDAGAAAPAESSAVPDSANLARDAARDPELADRLVAVAIVRDPAHTVELVRDAVAALPSSAALEMPGRIAGAASSVAPARAPDIAEAAAEGAALAIAKPDRRGTGSPSLVLAAASLRIVGHVILAVGRHHDTGDAATYGTLIAKRVFAGAMSGAARMPPDRTSTKPLETLLGEAVLSGAIRGAAAGQATGAQNDMTMAAARANETTDAVAADVASSALAVCGQIVRALFAATLPQAKGDPVAMASAMTDVAVKETRTVVEFLAVYVRSVGVTPTEAQKIGRERGSRAEQEIAQAAAAATLAALQGKSPRDIAAAAGPALRAAITAIALAPPEPGQFSDAIPKPSEQR